MEIQKFFNQELDVLQDALAVYFRTLNRALSKCNNLNSENAMNLNRSLRVNIDEISKISRKIEDFQNGESCSESLVTNE